MYVGKDALENAKEKIGQIETKTPKEKGTLVDTAEVECLKEALKKAEEKYMSKRSWLIDIQESAT